MDRSAATPRAPFWAARRRRGRHGGYRKGVGLTSVLALVAGLVTATAVATTVGSTPASAAPGDPGTWSCATYGYLFQTPDDTTHQIYQVDLVTGAASELVDTADEVNAVGYNALDGYMYGWDFATQGVVRIAGDGALTQLGVPDGMAAGDQALQYFSGDVDATGTYWILAGTVWYQIDLASMQVVGHGTAPRPAGTGVAFDWAAIDGNLYTVVSSTAGDDAQLVEFNTTDKSFSDLGTLAGMPGDGISYGAVYVDASGRLYVADNSGPIYRVDVDAHEAILVTADGPNSSRNDGARCADAPIPTITVTKTVDERVSADDQFTVSLQNADGDELTSATTSGTETTVSTTDWPVSADQPYFVIERTTDSSPNGIDAYDATISCQNSAGDSVGSTLQPDGSWQVTSGGAEAITCNVTNEPAPPGPAWQCDPYGYLFQTNGAQTNPHTVTRIDLVTGAATDLGETASYVNAVGYNTTDDYFYAWDITNSQIVKIASDLTQTPLGVPAGLPVAAYITGDFDGDGHYWLTTNAAPDRYWAEIDYAAGSPTYGQVIQQGTMTSDTANIPSDWSYIDGTLYGVRRDGTTGPVHLFSFDPANSTIVDEGQLNGPSDWIGAGATYTDGTYLYGSDNPTGDIYRINPDNRQTILVSHGPASSGNDGARCSTAPIPTITVTKTVEARVSPTDEFMVGLENSTGTGLTSATTSGSDSTASTTDWPVSPNAEYTITDETTTGSPNTIDAYDATISCQTTGGDDVPATAGDPGEWTITSSTTEAITCEVTNAPAGLGQTFQCLANAPGMLFQHDAPASPPTSMNTIDMVTGEASTDPVFTVDDRAINAVGYNVLDDYVYGWDRNTNKGVVRVDSDGNTQLLGLPPGFGAYQAPIIGDVDDQGHYWIVSQLADGGQNKHWFEIDLNPGGTFMTILNDGDITWTASADWAFLPGTNALYTVGTSGDDVRLYRFDRDTHTLADLGSLGAGGTGITNPGAMYADPNGHLYTSNNTGGAIYRVDVNAVSAAWFADGPGSSGNDGARCANSPIAIDFGDAPVRYDTTLAANGPRHLIPGYDEADHTAAVMLGAHIDAEDDGQPNPGADGDDISAAADEDGVTFNPDLGYATPTLRTGVDADTQQAVQNHLTVKASADGFVSVWVDWNEDGDFADDGERVANVQGVTVGDNDISFAQGDNPPGIHTYVRVRYSTDAASIAEPTGSAPDGEVEDYRVQVERLIVPSSCTISSVEHYAFTFDEFDYSGDGGPGTTARFHDVSVIHGVPVDMIVDVISGGTHRIGLGTGGVIGLDDADWQVNENATLQYSFVQAGTDTPVDVNAVFTVSDMDGPPQSEVATFDAADLADYAVTQGSAVIISQAGGQVSFAGQGAWNGDPESRFQIVLEGISTLQASWQGGANAGFGFDGDGDLSILPACSDFGDAPDSFGTTLAEDGARATMVPGLTLGTAIDFDPDGQPGSAADGDDTNRADDEDGVTAPIEIQTGVPTVVQVSVTNTTGDAATLAGWIDLDYSDAFDSAELQQVSIPANSGTATYTLTWPAQDPPGDPTFARFRLFAGDVAQPSPTGDWPDGGEVEDYQVQSRALSIVKSSDATAATRVGDTVHYTVRATNIGGADFTTDNPAQVIDDLTNVLDDGSLVGDVQVTGSDIDATFDDDSDRIAWSGPLASGDSVTLEYGIVLNKAGDQDVDNVAFQPPPCTGDDCETPPTPPGTDCDQNDGIDPATDLPCDHHEFFLPKLTVTKASDDLATAQIGDTVHYSITATNTGKADYTGDGPATMVDDLSGLFDSASYDGNAAITDEPDAGPGTVTYSDPQITWTGALGQGDSVTVTYSVTVTGSDELENVVFEWPTCTGDDCTPPSPPAQCTDGVDPITGLSCDDITGGIPELEISKSAPDLADARIGDTITWTVTATNVGTRDYATDAPAAVVDDLTGVLDDVATFDEGSITVEGSDVDAVYSEPQIGWAGPLAQGDTVTISYSAVLTGAGDGHVDNVVWQIPPGPTAPCDLGSCPPPDPGDCTDDGINSDTGLPCVEVDGPLPLPELTKTSSPENPHIGDVVTYTVTLTNTGPGDYSARRPAQVADDLTGVLDDATFDGTVTTKGSDIDATYDASATPPQIVWTGPLASGDTVTLTYQVTFTGAGDLTATNVAYVPPPPPACDADDAADCPPPPVPTPPDPADCTGGVDSTTGLPCVPVIEELPKLDIAKTSPDLRLAHIGDTVTYTVTAKSVGARDFTADDPALVIDDLAGVLDDATFDGAVATDGSDTAATYSEPRITWTGPLAVGDTVTLTYTVRLTGAGDLSVANVAFVPPPPPTDCGDECPPYDPPTPNTGDCVDGVDSTTNLPCVPVVNELPKLDITKTSPNLAAASIGDEVVYVVTATNVGQRNFGKDDPALVLDDLSGVLDDATFDGKVTVDGSKVKATYDEPRITWTGPLAVGDTVTLTYRVQLTGDGDLQVTNVAFVPPPPPTDCADECPPYDPPTPPAQDCASNNNVDPDTGMPCVPLEQDLRELQITKSSNAAGIVRNGDVVAYTVTATNVGPGDYTDDLPATVVDDLTGVLDDATYNEDVTADLDGDLGYDEGQLSWVGALPAGQSVTITYTVTVTGQGDLDLLNVAFTPPPLDAGCAGSGTCPTPDPEDCVGGADAVTGQPCAVTEMPLPALYVTKQVDSTSAAAGDTLSFTVTMTNTGNVDFPDADPAVLTDDLSGVLDDAVYNDDGTADTDGDLGYADPTLTWSGALPVGATVTVTYTVTINDTKTGDDRMDNVASIPDGITPRYPDGTCPNGAQSCDPPSPQAITVSDVHRAVPPELPNTGTDTWGQLQTAALLLLFGLALLIVGRRRRRTA